MKLEEMVDIVADYIESLNGTPHILAHSLMHLEEAYKVIIENPQITLEEYLIVMNLPKEE